MKLKFKKRFLLKKKQQEQRLLRFKPKIRRLGKIKRKKIFKPRFFKRFNHPFFVRFQHNNLFLTTWTDTRRNALYHFSMGRLADYQRRKKKKKTYMAGFELGNIIQSRLLANQIRTLRVAIKGSGAHLKGFYQGITRHRKIRISQILNKTPIAHNGTRAQRKRRL